MIKLYPVLVSNSVSKNIIPGIMKSVERFALIYKLDDLARSARKDAGISLKKVGKRLVMRESDEEIAAFLANEILHEAIHDPTKRHQTGTKTPPGKSTFSYIGSGASAQDKELAKKWNDEYETAMMKGRGQIAGSRFEKPPAGLNARQKDLWYRWKRSKDEEFIAKAKERGKQIGRSQATPADATISIGQMDMNSIMLEPTWMKIDRVTKYGQKFTSVLGVKAVSVPVRSDATLAQLLTFDKNVGRLMHLVLKVGRWVTGKLYRVYSKTIQKLIDPDPKAISGDPYKDIVLKRTIIAESNVNDVFLVLNQADLADDFAIDAKGIRKLMSLGWQSFCIADDVNRRLTFCMSEFKGMCNVLPYTMVYQTLNQAKVFEDLEEVRRTSASIFKARIPMKKVLGESMAQQKLEEFGADLFGPLPEQTQEFLNEISYIDESFASVTKKILTSPKQYLLRALKGTAKTPRITMDKALKIARKVDPQFPKAHALAKRVLKNSIKVPELSETHLDWAAMTVVIRAKTLPGRNLMIKTKDVLMSVIPLFRKALRKAQQSTLNIPPQHRVEAVFGLITVFILISVLGFFYTWTVITSFKVRDVVKAKGPGWAKDAEEMTTQAGTTLTEFVGGILTKVKNFFLASTHTEPKEIVTFWKKIFTDSDRQLEIRNAMKGYKEQFDTFIKKTFEEGGAYDNLKDTLKVEYDVTIPQIGAMMLLTLIGIIGMLHLLRPPKQ